MHLCMEPIAWHQLRSFLAVSEAGSLSAAARRLGLTQPTLGRQIAALEAQLGVLLFDRVGKRLVATDAGLALLKHARAMGEAADHLALAARGLSQSVEGRVTVSASDAVAAYLLPPVVELIRVAAPRLVIEVIASNALSDLKRRQADIAIRHVRPTDPDLFARLLRETEAQFYASGSWVRRNGNPASASDLNGAMFIGLSGDEGYADVLRTIGLDLPPNRLPVRSENSIVSWEMARRGLGICAMLKDVARLSPDMVRVLAAMPAIKVPLWLVTHREIQTSRRIRIVFDAIADALTVGS